MNSQDLELRGLDELYCMVNSIYLDRNFYRDQFSIFAHLVEVMGALSLLASSKKKASVDPQQFVAKAIAWWMTLCGKVGVQSVENMIWWKFPYACTYCHRQPHDNGHCIEMKKLPNSPDWDRLQELGNANINDKPKNLKEWQQMFGKIYPTSDVENYPATFARFTEELGELAEALRVFNVAPGYFLSEAADVFAWLMHLQNIIDMNNQVYHSDRGKPLAIAFKKEYADKCKECNNPVCTCPPVLVSTLGRIAHEVPANRASFSEGGALLTIDKAIALFEKSGRKIVLGDKEYRVDTLLINEIHNMTDQLSVLISNKNKELSGSLSDILRQVQDLTDTHKVTQENVNHLAETIAHLPSESRSIIMGFLTHMAAGPWVAAFLKVIENMSS